MPRTSWWGGTAALIAMLTACSADDTSRDGGDAGLSDAGASGSEAGSSARTDAGQNGLDGGLGAGGAGGTTDGGQLPPHLSFGDAGMLQCGAQSCMCSNGLDDDGDGLVDGADPECTAAFDNDEGSFATGVPGDNQDPNCQDCFFDGNSGSGDDGCRYASSCLLDGTPSSGSGACATCEVSQRCLDTCRPATPNGCDCFGCCEVHLDGGSTVFIQIGGSCSLDQIDDTGTCPRCVQSTECRNECGRCELCPGKTLADLPADCSTDGDAGTGGSAGSGGGGTGGGEAGTGGSEPPGYVCEDGPTCGADLPCPAGHYCQLGCCLPTLL